MTFPPRGSRELRKGRFSQPGGLYFVTASTDQREKVFIHPEINRILREAIHWLEDKNKWDWRIYMIMPDHVHLLFQLGEGETLASVMKSWKGYTAGKILKWLSGQECPSHQAKAKDGQECPSHPTEENLCGRGLPTLFLPGGRGLPTPITHLWQEGYYDRFIRSEKELQEVIRYMAYNPVRAGLATQPEDYPYWKSKVEID